MIEITPRDENPEGLSVAITQLTIASRVAVPAATWSFLGYKSKERLDKSHHNRGPVNLLVHGVHLLPLFSRFRGILEKSFAPRFFRVVGVNCSRWRLGMFKPAQREKMNWCG